MPRVLFVDDEPHMLSGLRRMLRGHRAQLDFDFASSGQEALAHLELAQHEQQPVDVIVSDMRMPGMDGAKLLEQVQRRWPSCVRIVLSGEADRQSVLAAVGSAQQFLAKPCDPEMLMGVVRRALEVRRSLDDPAVAELIGGAASLPALPDVYHRLVTLMESPDLQLREVAGVLADDVATSADILRLVNSAFFGMPQDVTKVSTAVGLLGAENIRALVLTGSVFQVDGELADTLDVPKLRNQALRRTALGRRLCRAESWQEHMVDQVGLSCMLHDAGLLLLAQGMPEGTRKLVRELAADPRGHDPVRRAELETALYGCTVAQASAYLLGLWNFAPAVVYSLAAQPAGVTTGGGSDRDQALDFAQRRTLQPGEHVLAVDVPELAENRLASWNALADAVIRA